MNLKRLLLFLTSHFLFLTAAVVRADVWTPTALPPKEVGGGREAHTAVWTGKEMIVWGGAFGSNGVGRGGVYDPVSNTWRPTSIENLPSTYLGGHTAVWAGEPVNRMLVYGGNFPPFGGDGAMYDPEADRWTKIEVDGDPKVKPPIPVPPNAPRFRLYHSAVWTGEEMIVWGGHCTGLCYRDDGAAYNPLTQQWRAIKTPPFLAARSFHSAYWTGTKMLVWGGRTGAYQFNDGGLYDPKTDEWTPINTAGAPLRSSYSTVWTGKEMIVWGGQQVYVEEGQQRAGAQFRPDGMIYDPALDRWRPMSTTGLPTDALKRPLGREYHTAVWTGEEMIVWGGHAAAGVPHLGHRYNLEAGVWLPVTNAGTPTNRDKHTAVWTGREMIVWGGRGGGGLYGYAGPTGGAYRPACGAYVFEPQAGARLNREVTFRLQLSPSGALRRAQLVLDGAPYGEPQAVPPDSRVKFKLGDELTGPYKIQVRTEGADGTQCLSPEMPVAVGPTVKVLALTFDPKFEFKGGKTYSETFCWQKPKDLIVAYNKALLDASGGFAKYEVVNNSTPIVLDDYPKEINGHVLGDEELYNRGKNDGWANLIGVSAEPDCKVPPFIGPAPNGGVPLGSSAGTMRYAQSFRVWGSELKRIKLGLSRVGSPTRNVRVSVRAGLDNADLCGRYAPAEGGGLQEWCGATVEPAQVSSTSAAAPTQVELAAPTGKDFTLILPDALHYLVVELEGSGPPDPNNYYNISVLKTPPPFADPGRPAFTDADAELFGGAGWERVPFADMSVRLMFNQRADFQHLLQGTQFDVGGKSQTVAAHVREGSVDEVYVFVGAAFNLWEAAMFGPDRFKLNSGPIDIEVDSGRAFALMGFNYQRGLAEMLEDYGHRTEGTMTHVYGGWNNRPNEKTLPTPLTAVTNWDKFTIFSGTKGDNNIGCGTVHFPPNATNLPYKWNILNAGVSSTCEGWLKYPNVNLITGVNSGTWHGTHEGYLRWWLTHLPKMKGRNDNGDRKLNNWWRYVVEPDYYKQRP
jgi:hypothetical protein